MHDALSVEVADCHYDLERIELDHGLWQTLLSLENLVQLTATDERHDKVESRLRLEQVLHPNEEGVIATEKNVFFKPSVLHLLEVKKYVLADSLDRELLVRRVIDSLSQEHLPEGTFAKESFLLKIFQSCCIILPVGHHNGHPWVSIHIRGVIYEATLYRTGALLGRALQE